MKRANGMGSVYKLSGKRRKPYAAAVTENGKQVVLDTFLKQKEAFEYLEDYIKNPYSIDYSKFTAIELFNKWFQTYHKSDSQNNSIRSAFMNHSKKLHNTQFKTITTEQIQQLVDDYKGSYTIKSYIKSVWSYLYNYAVQINLGSKVNYADYVKVGKKEKSDMHKCITNNDFDTLWNNKDKEFIDIILIYIYTSARAEELLNVEKTEVFLSDNYLIGGNKTEAGIGRTMPIHSKIKPFIEKHFNKNKKYLFETIPGKKMTYKTFLKKFKEALSQLNLEEDYLPHDTRHTFSTYAKLVEMDDLCRKLIMGHSIQDLTDRVYTHIPLEKLIEEVEKLK